MPKVSVDAEEGISYQLYVNVLNEQVQFIYRIHGIALKGK